MAWKTLSFLQTIRVLPHAPPARAFLIAVAALAMTVALWPIAAHGAPLHVGVAKTDITPRQPVVLAGFGGRQGPHVGVDAQLWARALVLGAKRPAAIVAVDNCGVPAAVVQRLAKRLAAWGIARERLIVAATHTHNAPTVEGYAPIVWAGRLTDEQQRAVKNYTAFLVDQMAAAVKAALATREPMQLEWGRGRLGFGGNRRVLRNGRWAGFGFRRQGPVDHSLPLLAARDACGRLRAVWANYACHCTTVGSGNRVSGDWAGFANKHLEKQFPHAISLVTIGCGADVGPQPSGSLEIAERHGESLATEVKRLLTTGKTQPLKTGMPTIVHQTIRLPLAEPPPLEVWEKRAQGSGFEAERAKAVLAHRKKTGSIPSSVEYPLTVWRFGDQLAIVFLAGEVVVDYSVRLGRELDWSRLWITAWANDMPGYVPSRRLLKEGGYETDFSQTYYAQPARYAPEIEDRLVGAVRELAGPAFRAAADQPPAPFHRAPSRAPETYARLKARLAGELTASQRKVVRTFRTLLPRAQPAVAGLVKNDGQTTEWYNHAGDFVPRAFIRQERLGTELRWKSLPLKSGAEPSVLAFAGGVGWISQPATDGFALLLNERELLRFDVTRNPHRWVSSDGKSELLYLPTWRSDVDSAGFFFLVLAGELGAPQKTVRLGVRSLGRGSKRWFALDSRQEIAKRMKRLETVLRSAP